MTRRRHRRVIALSEADRRALRSQASEGPGVQGPAAEPESVIPREPAGDSAPAWGDEPDDNDRRLIEDVPPHW